MLGPNSLMFARVVDPSPYMSDRPRVAIVELDAPGNLAMSDTSLAHFVESDFRPILLDYDGFHQLVPDGSEEFGVIIVFSEGDLSNKEHLAIAATLNSCYSTIPRILCSQREIGMDPLKELLSSFDCVGVLPLDDEKLSYAIRRLSSKRSNFPMRKFQPEKTHENPPLLKRKIVFSIMSVLLIFLFSQTLNAILV